MDRVVNDREVLLLRSPRNAARLLAALERARGDSLAAVRLEDLEAQLDGGVSSEKRCAIQRSWTISSTGSEPIAAPPAVWWS
jgi:hypothetical protein